MRTHLLVAFGFLVALPACGTTGVSPSDRARLSGSEAGRVVLESMYSHGYPEWTEKGGIVFKLRTEDLSGPEPCLVVEDCVYDTLEHRAFSKRMQGGASVGSLFTGEALQEIPGSLEEEFSENIAETGTETKQKLLSDYFYTVLPFIVVRLPVDFTLVGTDSVNGVNYFVIDICFECEG